MVEKKFPYRRLWQAEILTRKVARNAIPIHMSLFKRIRGNIGLHGYRRIRKQDEGEVRAYRKDAYGETLVFIDVEHRAIEAKTETWGGLMGLCSDFDLTPYRHA
ncbi:MAG: hypothetical protein ACYTEL_00330 [Planctomycetota bacterium]|jgi:hypothetical protein